MGAREAFPRQREGLALFTGSGTDRDGRRPIVQIGRMLRTMDMSNNLPAGIYMVNVTVEGQLFTQRLVMQ